MTIYDNVAQSDPYGSKALISSYGFVVPPNSDDPDVLAQALCDLVAEVGDKALTDIVDMHPDKDLILEKCGQRAIVQSEAKSPPPAGGCGCGGKCKGEKSVADNYINYATEHANNNLTPLHQGNIFLIGAAFLLAVAIIVSNKKQ